MYAVTITQTNSMKGITRRTRRVPDKEDVHRLLVGFIVNENTIQFTVVKEKQDDR